MMRIKYSYSQGMLWQDVWSDLLSLIVGGAAALAGLASGRSSFCSVSGSPQTAWKAGSVYGGAGSVVWRVGVGGRVVAFSVVPVATGSVGGLFARSVWGADDKSLMDNGSAVGMIAGQAAGADTCISDGWVRVAVNDLAIAFSFDYGTGRQLAVMAEADGDFFENAYPRGFFMTTQAAISGIAADCQVRVPYFERVKYAAGAGEKIAAAAQGTIFAAAASLTTSGYSLGVGEKAVYQALPLEVWSYPKWVHMGFARGVLLAPGKGVANDDLLVVGGKNYVVFRENLASALAVAIEA